MYVLKFSAPEYSWGYCIKGLPHVDGQTGWFSKHEVFETTQEAQDYIQVLLQSKETWCDATITEENFEVVEVKQYEGLGPYYYTEKEAKNMRDAI